MLNFFIRVFAVFNAILVSAKKKFLNFLIDFYLLLQKMLSSLPFFYYDCRACLNSSFCSDLSITPRWRTTLVFHVFEYSILIDSLTIGLFITSDST